LKNRFVSIWIGGIGILAMLAAVSIAQAGVNSDTISIKFGAEQPNNSWLDALNPTDQAGAPNYVSANWNNAGGQSDSSITDTTMTFGSANKTESFGTPNVVPLMPLVRDTNGVSKTSNATISWSSAGTWSSRGTGENNDTFPLHSPDFILVTGYLDTGDINSGNFTDITITGLDADMAAGYSVVIYTQGGVPNRPAAYFVNDPNMQKPKYVVPTGDKGQFNGAYHEAIGDDPDFGTSGSDHDFGNYVVFTGLTGDVAIHAEPRTFRAVVNAIQIVKNP
jgi:hypothetical protein